MLVWSQNGSVVKRLHCGTPVNKESTKDVAWIDALRREKLRN